MRNEDYLFSIVRSGHIEDIENCQIFPELREKFRKETNNLYLFSLSSAEYKEYLKEGDINDDLIDAFEDEDCNVDSEAELFKEDEKWFISEDGEKKYRIEVGEEKLNTYNNLNGKGEILEEYGEYWLSIDGKEKYWIEDTGKELNIYELKTLEEFIQDLKLREMSPATIRSYRSNVRRFLEIVPDYEEADEKDIKKYLKVLKEEKGLAYKTLANNFASVSSFFDYLKYEGIVDDNPVLSVRKRYLNKYKDDQNNGHRQVPEVKKISAFINYIPKIRDKAVVLLLFKTGIRRNELIDIDVDDINWEEYSIELKPKPKRSNTRVYFDNEMANVLKRWLAIRDERDTGSDALFLNERGNRLKKKGIRTAVEKWAEKYGLHDPDSEDLEDKFTPHTLRTVYTTYLIRSGMRREYIKELRGDTRGEAMDIYHQIDHDELRKEYEACMPELGIV